MVGPNGLEPSTSSVSRKRSNQTELRAYMRIAVDFNSTGGRQFRQRLDKIKIVRLGMDSSLPSLIP
jgi:hypothetical protein